ncbi:PadR family transcriptional regulator [Planctomonas deserti]|uniref:PadR family transcriptional regulator n=1 Tax=Planctomonas deserti TaxID=2144185 RepID=UPI000D34CEE8|nr:PadR family transcriptional regulator [Planctomonas deserti]
MLQKLDIITLGLLRQGPHTGYDVRRWLNRYGWALGYSAQTSQIYRQLGRLVERGWAASTPDPRGSGPDAKLYALTEDGREAFEAWVDSPYQPAERPMDPDFQVRMYFSRHRGPATLLELVRMELRFRRAQHDRRVPLDAGLIGTGTGPRADSGDADDAAWALEASLLLESRGRLLAATLIAWLESAEDRLAHLAAALPAPSPSPDPLPDSASRKAETR